MLVQQGCTALISSVHPTTTASLSSTTTLQPPAVARRHAARKRDGPSSSQSQIIKDTRSNRVRVRVQAQIPGRGGSKPNASSGAGMQAPSTEYKPTPLDDLFLMLFRQKLVKETGWQSPKPGYEGMIEEAKKLLAKFPRREDAEESAVHILVTMFPPGLLPLFKRFIPPLADGRLAAFLSAQVTVVTCQWLMGPSKPSDVTLPNGSSFSSGVKIDKCRFLEETKCVGSCIHTCKMPTQAFMWEHMGVPLHMEPNFEDFSCEFKFGVPAPQREEDPALITPCLSVCPVANNRSAAATQCPQVSL